MLGLPEDQTKKKAKKEKKKWQGPASVALPMSQSTVLG